MKKGWMKGIKKFYTVLGELHVYKSKPEGIFKALAILISWGGGVNIPNFSAETKLDSVIAASFFLYAIAIIMEYIVQLVSEKRFVKKVIPLLMICPSILVFLVSICMLLQRPLNIVPMKLTYWCTIVPWMIILTDVFIQLMVEKPKLPIVSIATEFQNVDVEGNNG